MALIYFVILPSKWVFFIGSTLLELGTRGALLWFRAGRTILRKKVERRNLNKSQKGNLHKISKFLCNPI